MVTIIDINDIPPIFKLPWTKENPYYTITSLEEQPVSSLIGTFSATDDSGIDRYDIIPNNPYINVNQSTGNLVKYKNIKMCMVKVIIIKY